LPFLPQLGQGIAAEVTDDINISTAKADIEDTLDEGNYISYNPHMDSSNTGAPDSYGNDRTIMILNIIFYIWVAGIIVFVGVNITANLIFYLKLGKSPYIENESITTLLNDLCNEMNISRLFPYMELLLRLFL